jgi:hypothetical protein
MYSLGIYGRSSLSPGVALQHNAAAQPDYHRFQCTLHSLSALLGM